MGGISTAQGMTDESETTYGLRGPVNEARQDWGMGLAACSRKPAAVAQVEEHPGVAALLILAGRPPACRTA
jgi:hypothetical protein